jgi:hypothetical protein
LRNVCHAAKYAPLVAADAERLEGVMEAAHDLAKAKNLKMRLIARVRAIGRAQASAPPMTIFAFRIETRSTWRSRARMTPMRANIVGPPSDTTSIKAPIAACHSSGQRFGWAGGLSVAASRSLRRKTIDEQEQVSL